VTSSFPRRQGEAAPEEDRHAEPEDRVKAVPLRIPRRVGPQSLPFQVEEGRAYYIGDYVGSLSQSADNYVVYARVKTTWGLSRVSFDYEGATAELKQRYPGAASVDTFPAWNARPEGGAPNALLHPVKAARSAMLDLGTPR
jgi:hypothetical protein